MAEMREDLGMLYRALIHTPSLGVALMLGLSMWLTWVVLFVMEIPVVAVLGPLVRRPLFYPLSHIFRHQVVAAGSCASCGYAMTGLPTSPDGFLVCPECRAAWRADRRLCPEPLEGVERRRKLRAKLDLVVRFGGATDSRDHRDRAASLSVYRPRTRRVGAYGDVCYSASAAIHQPGRGRAAGVMLACFAGGVVLAVIAIMVANALGALPWWGYGFVVLLAGLVFIGFAAGVSDLGITPEEIELATLSHGLCPSCWELIHGLPAGDDGCTSCPECGSAWRLPEPAPDRLPPPACRACGYDLRGLDPDDRGVITCPECGDVWVR